MKRTLTISLVSVVVMVIAVGIYVIAQNRKKVASPISKPIAVEPVQQPIAITDGRQCYNYSHEATQEEPVTSTEFIDMTISGNTVTGTKRGTQSGPELTNGWDGTITGSLKDGTINVAFAYTVEGSKNTEHEIYQAGLTGIDKLRYPLIDKYQAGLFPDTTKEFALLHYARVGCEGAN